MRHRSFPRTTRLLVMCAFVVALLPVPQADAVTYGYIAGHVYDDSGGPLGGITVKAWLLSVDGSSWSEYMTVTSGSNGAYALAISTLGRRYAVEFVDPGGTYVGECYDNAGPATISGPPPEARVETVTALTNIPDWDAYLGRSGAITGTVRDASGTPVQGIAINAYRHFGGGSYATTVAATTQSGADGGYALKGLGGGEYALQFNQTLTQFATHFRSASPTSGALDKANATPVAVSVGATVTGVDETMYRYSKVGGTVRGTAGALLNGVLVELYRWEGGDWRLQILLTDNTDSNGVFDAGAQVYPGTYRVRLSSAAGYPNQYHLTAVPIEFGTDVPIAQDTTVSLDTTMLASDGTSPVSTTTPLPESWVNHPVVASFTASDEPDGSGLGAIYWTLAGSSPTVYTGPVTISAEGENSFAFWAVDRFGNAETSHTSLVRIDSTVPTTPGSGDTSGAWRNSTATITLSPSDTGGSGLAGTWYSVDGVVASGTVIAVASEGVHPVEWGSVDVAGNRETTHAATVRIDSTVPSTTASGFADGVWQKGPVDVTLSPSDSGGSGLAGTWYTVDGGAVTSGTVFSVTAEGIHPIEWGSFDVAGNRETTHTGSVRVDSTSPTTPASGDLDGAWRNRPATITLSPSDTGGSGLAGTWFSIDGVVASGTVVSVATEGVHPVRWGSFDGAGNRDATQSATIRIDLTPPTTVPDAYPGSGAFTLSPSDAGGSGLAGTWYSLDGGGWTAGTSVSAGVGTHSLHFYSEDAAGNRETTVGPVSFTVAAPSEPPVAPPSEPPVVTPVLPKASLLTRPYAGSYTVYRYRSVPVYGYLKPRHTAGVYSVTLQAYHYEDGRWVRRATWLARNSNYSTYTKYVRASIAFKYRGRWRVRAYHSDSRHAPTYSTYSYFTVR